jgi:hypothetical protein
MLIPYTAFADASGNATITINDVKSGLTRVIGQISVECNTAFRPGAACTIRMNRRYLTSTILASGDAAYNQPYVAQNTSDVITADFSGFQNKDELVVTLYCVEIPWTANPPTSITV